MKHEILFRGKRLDNEEWIYGSLLTYHDGVMEIAEKLNKHTLIKYEVDPATVGRYTGLTDKNGKKIFEGDIVNLHYFFEDYDLQTLGAFENENEIVAEIRIDEYGVFFVGDGETGYLCNYLQEPSEELEVIGNIHDNPELLGGAK